MTVSSTTAVAVTTKKPRKKQEDKTADKVMVISNSDPSHKDNSLREFRKICVAIANESSYNVKTKVLKNFFEKGTDGGKVWRKKSMF